MPLYEYRCDKCGERTEVIQTFSEKPLKICPHCGERALRKMFSAPAIQFKGSGWYVTDYAGRKGEPKEGGSEGADKGDAAADAKKSDKAGKSDKTEKPAKTEKSEKIDKSEKPKKGKRD